MKFKTSDPGAFQQLPDGQVIELVGRPDIRYRRSGNTMDMVGHAGGYHISIMAEKFDPESEWMTIDSEPEAVSPA